MLHFRDLFRFKEAKTELPIIPKKSPVETQTKPESDEKN